MDPNSNIPRERWIGGIVPVRGFRHLGKPMRVAAWITPVGIEIAAAIVEGHGPTVLRALLDDALRKTAPSGRPSRLVVWPVAQAAFRDLKGLPVDVHRDEFLKVVVEDGADAGQIPGDLPVRCG